MLDNTNQKKAEAFYNELSLNVVYLLHIALNVTPHIFSNFPTNIFSHGTGSNLVILVTGLLKCPLILLTNIIYQIYI